MVEFEAHLVSCLTCSQEIAEFRETAAELTLLSLATPPPTLRNRILDAIANTPPLPA